ncbi:ThiF family adenylyltransferase [Hymenobacter sp. ASUV-10]|uniref:ThiF family adenylyltransferase n=1 Tax=Hymenobacter aranciens TaxID=3063996 RepID=A0ABT9B7H8_9BACT|nr:ThiF family adenylyltransferase [Hymenobacter sp. ASUV-10]MDO7874234.1 ThiF family adenylyltransferase [Hymenobacter sp. ASUV-10]
MKTYKLRINGRHYAQLREHLFPGDGNEAIAFALCGRYQQGEEEIYSVHHVELYPHEKCLIRRPDRVMWSPPDLVPLFERCRHERLFLLKVHCHPGHWPWFSEVDDESDWQLAETLTGWTGRQEPLLSAIMLADGHVFGRAVGEGGQFTDIDYTLVVGDDLYLFRPFDASGRPRGTESSADPEVQLRTRQAFGEGTTNILRKLRVGVVGCSGTGSITAELLGRLGVGQLVLVDPDKVELKNLNRILNSTLQDADEKRPKVRVLKAAIEAMGTGVEVEVLDEDLHSFKAYHAIAGCDVVFGCMDSVDGRYLLNRIATFFVSAYFDMGVRLNADGAGGIDGVDGRVDYLQPGGSSLLSRGRFTPKQLADAGLARTDPQEYERQLKEGYVKGAQVDSPAVISINMFYASQAVNELLARLHPFRSYSNARLASIEFSISGVLLIKSSDGEPDKELSSLVGLGEIFPPLRSPRLIVLQEQAAQ